MYAVTYFTLSNVFQLFIFFKKSTLVIGDVTYIYRVSGKRKTTVQA